MKKLLTLSVPVFAAIGLVVLVFLGINSALAQLGCGSSALVSCLSDSFFQSRGGAVFGTALTATGTALYVPKGQFLIGDIFFRRDPLSGVAKPRFYVGYPDGTNVSVGFGGIDIRSGILAAAGNVIIGAVGNPRNLTVYGPIWFEKDGTVFTPAESFTNQGEDTIGPDQFTTCSGSTGPPPTSSCSDGSDPTATINLVDTCDGVNTAKSSCVPNNKGVCRDIISSGGSGSASGDWDIWLSWRNITCRRAFGFETWTVTPPDMHPIPDLPDVIVPPP